MQTYKLRKQVKNRGCYAEIVFDIVFLEGSEQELIIEYKAASQWEQMCKAGITIFYDYFRRERRGRLEVIIYEIDWLPIDTNNLIVLFASVSALMEGAGIQHPDLKLDIVNEVFCFPEYRKAIL